MLSPSVNTNILSIDFSAITTDASPLTSSCLLAAATGGVFYTSGLIVAQYTSGPDAGKIVNYSATGTNGQEVPIGVIYDDLLAANEAGNDGKWATFIVHNTKGALYMDQLIGTIVTDVAAFITALSLRKVIDYNTSRTLLYGL